jgi:hypothetical protein
MTRTLTTRGSLVPPPVGSDMDPHCPGQAPLGRQVHPAIPARTVVSGHRPADKRFALPDPCEYSMGKLPQNIPVFKARVFPGRRLGVRGGHLG